MGYSPSLLDVSISWLTEKRGLHPRYFFDFFGRRSKLRLHFGGGKLAHIRMRFAVRAKLVPPFHDFFGVFGVLFHPKFDGEKGAAHVVAVKLVKDFVRMLYPPRAIEGNRDFLLACGDRIDGKLALRSGGSGGKAESKMQGK